MKRLISLAVVVAFFVAVPQCLGQSQDAEQLPAQLLEEQQLVQMSLLMMAPPTIVAVPVSNLLQKPDRGPKPDQGPKVDICHFKQTRKHCDGLGGGEITVVFESKSYFRHLDHGDCTEGNYDPAPDDCPNHCVALGDLPLCKDGGLQQ